MVGVLFPLTEKGDRSTTQFTKDVFRSVAESLGCNDIAAAIKSDKSWRQKYDAHAEEVAECLAAASLFDVEKMSAAIEAGLEKSISMDFDLGNGEIVKMSEAMQTQSKTLDYATVKGKSEPKMESTIPYDGTELSGDKLDEQAEFWAKVGTIEPNCAQAIKVGSRRAGQMKDRLFLVLGASSELGAVRPLLESGATVAAVMRKNTKRWSELVKFARNTGGTLLAPVAAGESPTTDDDIAKAAGADLLKDAPGILEWFLRVGTDFKGQVTVCTYLYADGEANVRLTASADYIVQALSSLGKDKVSFAYLVSGSTSHLISKELCDSQEKNFAVSNMYSKFWGKRLDCTPSGAGVTFWKEHCQDQDPEYFFYRGVVNLQGPNYLVAQYMRQWRAVLLHMQGFKISTPVTPNCRTESVVHNNTMKVWLDGVGYWRPMESFDPDTARMAMFAILVSDLTEEYPKFVTPLHIFGHHAFHSGMWRCPFQLGSLGISTFLLGKFAPRKKTVFPDIA